MHDSHIGLEGVIHFSGSNMNPGFGMRSIVRSNGNVVTMHARVWRTSGSGQILLLTGGMTGITLMDGISFYMWIPMEDILMIYAGQCQMQSLNY